METRRREERGREWGGSKTTQLSCEVNILVQSEIVGGFATSGLP